MTITREADNGGDEEIDLSLTLSTTLTEYTQFVDIPYTLTITNAGSSTATGIQVNAPLPAGTVFTSANASSGNYELFFELWTIESLAPGESATLTLNLFPLVDAVDVVAFFEVIFADQPDSDSTPFNGNPNGPIEDDEVILILQSVNGGNNGGGGGTPEGDIDLELSIDTDSDSYEQYVDVTYTVTLSNNGPDLATDVVVSVPLPDGFVHTSNSATGGAYNLFFQRWNVVELAPGETIALDLVLFPLTNAPSIDNFVEVIASGQDDLDSTPDNGNGVSPQEDDEAVVTVTNDGFNGGGSANRLVRQGNPVIDQVFPTVTQGELYLHLEENTDSELLIEVVDRTGRVAQRIERSLVRGENRLEFEFSQLAPGQYFLRLNGEMNARTHRFTKL